MGKVWARIGTGIKIGSLLIGVPLFLLITVGILILLARIAYVEMTDPVFDEEKFTSKQAFLESLKPGTSDGPNIVVIFFDDMGWGDLSSYGNRLIKTPHIDQIAADGLRMTDFYSASPVCTPSRAALLTGRFPPRTGTDRHVFFNDHHLIGMARRVLGVSNELPKEEITLPEVLRKVGYHTGMVGKWHLGSRVGARPTDFGFDDWYGVLYSNDMYPLHLFHNDEMLIEDQREGTFFSGEWDEQKPLPGEGIDQTELTNMYTDRAIAFMEEAGDKPFFLYLSHSLPHVPHYAAKEFAGQSEGGNYGDVIEDLDRSTGKVMAALDRLGLSDNTLVVITSDNGADEIGSAGDLRGRKQMIFEGGQRVPMIVHWPGKVDKGQVSDAMGMGTDLFPTLLSLLNIPMPQDRVIDGKDLGPVFFEGKSSPHDYLYYFPTIETEPGAVRDDRFKLHWDAGGRNRSRLHLSRLDVDAEAHELSARHPEKFKELSQVLAAKREEIVKNKRGWK